MHPTERRAKQRRGQIAGSQQGTQLPFLVRANGMAPEKAAMFHMKHAKSRIARGHAHDHGLIARQRPVCPYSPPQAARAVRHARRGARAIDENA